MHWGSICLAKKLSKPVYSYPSKPAISNIWSSLATATFSRGIFNIADATVTKTNNIGAQNAHGRFLLILGIITAVAIVVR